MKTKYFKYIIIALALISGGLEASAQSRDSVIDMESWRGKSFTDDELRGFDISNLLDKWCMVTVQHRTANNGNVYADAVAITPVPTIVAKAGLPKGENPCLIFDLQKFDQAIFDGLSQGLKDQIMQSAEMRNKKDVNKLLQDAKIEDDEDLNVPF